MTKTVIYAINSPFTKFRLLEEIFVEITYVTDCRRKQTFRQDQTGLYKLDLLGKREILQ